jgi:hypothetical protein
MAVKSGLGKSCIYLIEQNWLYIWEGKPGQEPFTLYSAGCHSWRATGITANLENGGVIEKAQQIAEDNKTLRPHSG